MTTTAKATEVVHMITQTGGRQVLPDGVVSSDRSPEALLCGGDIVGATFNDAGNVVEYDFDSQGKTVGERLSDGAEMGTRLTDVREDVTCKKCLKKLPKEAT